MTRISRKIPDIMIITISPTILILDDSISAMRDNKSHRINVNLEKADWNNIIFTTKETRISWIMDEVAPIMLNKYIAEHLQQHISAYM